VALNAFNRDIGSKQGRLQPIGWLAPEGDYAFVLGYDAIGHAEQLLLGDYCEINQTADVGGDTCLMRASLRLRGPALFLAGASWRFSMRINDVEVAFVIIPVGRTLNKVDLAANVAKLAGTTVKVGFRLELANEAGESVGLPRMGAFAATVPRVVMAASGSVPLTGAFAGTVPRVVLAAAGTVVTASLPDPLIWWRSDLLTTSGGTISSITDQGTAGINAVQVAGVPFQPIYHASDAAFNNLPSIDPAGTGWLESAAPVAYGAHTIAWVGYNDVNAGTIYAHGNVYNNGGITNGGTNNADLFHAHAGSGSPAHAIMQLDRGGANFSNKEKTTDVQSATPKTYVVRYDGTIANHTLRINGVNQTVNNVSVFGTPPADPGTGLCTDYFGIFANPGNAYPGYPGTFPNGVPVFPINGRFGEWRIYDVWLSDSDTAVLEGLLRTRYAHY
jgi:hypothetical protein